MRADRTLWGLGAAAFLLAYNVEFRRLPASTAYLAVLLLVLLCWRRRLPLASRDVWVLLLGGTGLALWSVLRWMAGSTFDVVLRAQYLLVFGVVAGVLLAVAAGRSSQEVLRTFALAASVQALAIFLTYVSSGTRALLADHLTQSGNIELLYGGRPAGFSNSGGSLLAVTQALGACAALMWLWTTPRRGASRAQRWVMYGAAALCTTSSVLAGRAGIIVLALFVLARSLEFPKLVATVAGLMAGGVAGLLLLPSLVPESSALYAQAVDSRAIMLDLLQLWRGEFFDVYRAMPWPDVGPTLLYGEPAYFAPGSPTHDAGFVQTLGSVGLIGLVLAYAPIMWLAARRGQSRAKGWPLLCTIVLLLELKEPYIFKGPNLAFIVALALCARTSRDARSARPAEPSPGEVPEPAVAAA